MFRVSPASPVNDDHDLSAGFIDVYDDFMNQRADKLLPHAHRRGLGPPNGRQITREVDQVVVLRQWLEVGVHGGDAFLAGPEALESRIPASFEIRCDESIPGSTDS